MLSKLPLACALLASSAIVSAQEVPPVEASPSEAASQHQPPANSGADPAAAKAASAWSVDAPQGLTLRKVSIDTSEGTWMNVDVSPDGTRIAFDMLGDIYVMPISGGTPTRIVEGMAYDQQPRWSPDGTRIAFVSDRGGGDNIWIMRADGSDRKQLTKEDFRLLNQPSWSPDGRYIVAKKHFTTARSLGTGEVWLYHVDGGSGVQLVKRVDERHQKELGEPTFAPDGKHIYFSRDITPGATFQYAQDSNRGLFAIERYELETGETRRVTGGNGGAVRPNPSPDGKYLAFVRRERAKSKLYVRDLASGNERKLMDLPDQDMQETWAVTGVYPNMDWTADSNEIVLWSGGKIRRVPVRGGEARDIPFAIADDRTVAQSLHPEIEVAPGTFQTKMVRWAQVSPDGRQVVFESLGKLWVKSANGGEPRRLTRTAADRFEAWPSWSRDGNSIVFVDWADQELGRVMTVPASGGTARAVTSEPGHYSSPRLSPDGKIIVFEAGSGGGLTADRWNREGGTYMVPSGGGKPRLVERGGGNPQFGASSDRVFMSGRSGDKLQLFSTDLYGEVRRAHASGDLTSGFEVSPDGQYVAFRQNYEAHLMPLLPGSQDVTAATDKGALPAVRLSQGGGDFIHFSDGGRRAHWSIGPVLYSADTGSLFNGEYKYPVAGLDLSRTVRADHTAGTVALTGARIVTMRGEDGGIIEDGVILVSGDRITAVGPRADVVVPAGVPAVDLSGKTIVPGFIDAHAHGPQAADHAAQHQAQHIRRRAQHEHGNPSAAPVISEDLFRTSPVHAVAGAVDCGFHRTGGVDRFAGAVLADRERGSCGGQPAVRARRAGCAGAHLSRIAVSRRRFVAVGPSGPPP